MEINILSGLLNDGDMLLSTSRAYYVNVNSQSCNSLYPYNSQKKYKSYREKVYPSLVSFSVYLP